MNQLSNEKRVIRSWMKERRTIKREREEKGNRKERDKEVKGIERERYTKRQTDPSTGP